jgi:nicotinamide-nucleotide amidase
MNKTFTAEIISVGTELLLGNTTNTDARDISIYLSELGINVFYHTVVGDNPERLTKAVDIARSRADIIITTGGLGPTCDDLTKQVLAKAFDLEMVYHEELADEMRRYFKEILGVNSMTENNLSRHICPPAVPCSTMSGERLQAAPSRQRARALSCCPARRESATRCSKPVPCPI